MTDVTKKPTFNVPGKTQRELNRSPRSVLLHPYLQLFVSIILTAISHILLKLGVDTGFVSPWYTASNFFNFWIWLGVLAIICSLFSWLYALKSVPLIVAFNLAATNHIMVAFGSWLFLGEAISIQRWIGIFLVALGVFFIAKPVARAEEGL
ncbi:MAG: EamA family transporter [Verrucomicrobia bacterium]|nr:EamA family transporter [Verrucomicrobiota bacterium]